MKNWINWKAQSLQWHEYFGVISLYLLNPKHALLKIYFLKKKLFLLKDHDWDYFKISQLIIFVLFYYSNHKINCSICFIKSGLRKIVWFFEKFLFIESIFFKSLKFPATFINFEGQIRNLDLHALQAYMHTYALTCLDIMDCGRALLDGNTERTQKRKVLQI